MEKILNGCHGVFASQAGCWLCSTHPSAPGRVAEEVIGDEGEAPATGPGLGARPAARRGPPMPVGGPSGPEDEKETAKQRLQRLIRDFAHDAVGPGLLVQAVGPDLLGLKGASANGTLQALLRMDRRLSRMELWPPDAVEGNTQGKEALLKLPLQQVEAITKRSATEASEATADGGAGPEGDPRGDASLSISRRASTLGPACDMRITFDSPMARDRAYTCLRIFQMSVDQTLEGQSRETESDAAGVESNAAPTSEAKVRNGMAANLAKETVT